MLVPMRTHTGLLKASRPQKTTRIHKISLGTGPFHKATPHSPGPAQALPTCELLTSHAPLLVHQLHQALELLQVDPHSFFRECPALGILQGLQLEDRDIRVLAFQHVCQKSPQRRVALVQHLVGV